jgi:ABC-2 type transport system ATP-binding protein
MIEVRGLTKRFGRRVAVDELSFAVHPGRVNGFLGPNGACWIIQTTRLKLALRAISWGGGRHAGLRQQLYS